MVKPNSQSKSPRVPIEPIEPVSIEDVFRMVKTCKRGTFAGDRDAALLLCFLDTGARANELQNIDLDDINQARGGTLVQNGRGNKPHQVYLGSKSRRGLRKYLKHRSYDNSALWVTIPRFGSERLKYDGLRELLKRLAIKANVEIPTPMIFEGHLH